MNTVTLHGNLTAKPVARVSSNGNTVVNFAIALNNRRYDRATGKWVDAGRPLFQRVTAFHALAENAANTLDKGMAVTVTGELTDDSYYREGDLVRGTTLRASDIAVSLRFAVAHVARAVRKPTDEPADGAPTAEADSAQPADAAAGEAPPSAAETTVELAGAVA